MSYAEVTLPPTPPQQKRTTLPISLFILVAGSVTSYHICYRQQKSNCEKLLPQKRTTLVH
jgi:hypothetical protein